MALLRDLILKARPTLQELIKLECESLTLKPIKQITIKFDPFREDGNSIREFSHHVHSYSVLQTNPKCKIKTDILSDRTEPSVLFELVNGEKLIFQCTHLKSLEIFQLMNKHITPLAPSDDKLDKPVAQEQTSKKGKGKKK